MDFPLSTQAHEDDRTDKKKVNIYLDFVGYR